MARKEEIIKNAHRQGGISGKKLRIISQKGSKFRPGQVAIKVEGCYNIIDFL